MTELVRFWITIGTLVFNVVILVVVKFNDLKHISDDVRETKNDVSDIKELQLQHEGRISRLEGKLG